jgi:hypothetical protein
MIQTATLVAICVQELRRLITNLQTARPPDLNSLDVVDLATPPSGRG